MRRWGTAAASWFAIIAAPAGANAQPVAGGVATAATAERSERPPQRIGYGAMPGGLHVAAAETLPQGTLELALLSGFGQRTGLLGGGHKMSRAIGALAVAYAWRPYLLLGLSIDGRYDKHEGLSPAGDDGYVGDPRVLARFVKPLGKLSLGGQLGIWAPGREAPSIETSAISVDARALLSVDAGFATFMADAGLRTDNSAKSVDARKTLSIEDQASLGVSDFHAALAGVAVRVPIGARAYLGLEGSAHVFLGAGAPGAMLRGGALVGVAITDALSIVGYVEIAKVPEPAYRDALMKELVLVPYEPTFTGGLALQARFGGPGRGAAVSDVAPNQVRDPVVVVETADVRGVVVDDTGKSIVGAAVVVRLKNHSGRKVTDDKGAYVITGLPIGKTVDGKTELDDTGAEVTVEVANRKPGSATLTLARGPNTVATITLDPLLPPGQLRGVVTSAATGRPVSGATVSIEPGGITTTAATDGTFTVDLPPGRYKIAVTARGLAQQQLDVNIEENGVAIKNIELHK